MLEKLMNQFATRFKLTRKCHKSVKKFILVKWLWKSRKNLHLPEKRNSPSFDNVNQTRCLAVCEWFLDKYARTLVLNWVYCLNLSNSTPTLEWVSAREWLIPTLLIIYLEAALRIARKSLMNKTPRQPSEITHGNDVHFILGKVEET